MYASEGNVATYIYVMKLTKSGMYVIASYNQMNK